MHVIASVYSRTGKYRIQWAKQVRTGISGACGSYAKCTCAGGGKMKVMSAKEVGAMVRDARKSQGLTQRELAAACNCGVRFMSDLENGKPTIELGRALRVLNTLSLDVDISARSFS